ncbi:riboflavin synthase [Limibacillus halophilus]|uniref:Riboflavin synthase n=1 Tax=Limibacillus halophilus TaxID=1579333 RepID=A0A839SVK5_9PROT|nr:riboflavin synthase [Limibacillus halophilus]MBB3065734.1 riboflavin synthase [Limibacillus halophilus]
MFTGIITDLGRIRERKDGGVSRFVVETRYPTSEISLGASIACNGCCLTVVETGSDYFAVDVSAESLAKTNLDSWQPGTAVNLERALALGEELGGHLVSGHVDGLAEVTERRREGDSWRFSFVVEAALGRFIAPKGSICLNGVSLTVNEVADLDDGRCRFGVNIIPHTAEVTTFATTQVGDRLNLEIDLVARYLERLSSRE